MLINDRRNTAYTPIDNYPLSKRSPHDISNSIQDHHSQASYSANKQVRFQNAPPVEIHETLYKKTDFKSADIKKSKSLKSNQSKSNKSILSKRSSLSTISKKSVKKRLKRNQINEEVSRFQVRYKRKSPDRKSRSMNIKKRTNTIVIQKDGLNTQ